MLAINRHGKQPLPACEKQMPTNTTVLTNAVLKQRGRGEKGGTRGDGSKGTWCAEKVTPNTSMIHASCKTRTDLRQRAPIQNMNRQEQHTTHQRQTSVADIDYKPWQLRLRPHNTNVSSHPSQCHALCEAARESLNIEDKHRDTNTKKRRLSLRES